MTAANREELLPEEYAAIVQPAVAYCSACQPWEDGEAIWVLGHEIGMPDLLHDHDVPESLHDEVASLLRCENCGSELDLSSEVGTKGDEERAIDARWKQWREEYATDLNDFVSCLEKFPYLGATHRIGQLIVQQVAEFPYHELKTFRWWRARRVTDALVPAAADLGPPPLPPSSEGRFNHHGQRVFYLASSKEGAAVEVLAANETLAWVQEFEVKHIERLLELDPSTDHDTILTLPILALGLAWTRAHAQPASMNSEWKPQYFLPRFIADCARQHGFRGIVFPSPKHYDSNMVLFDWGQADVVAIGEPILFDRRTMSRPDEF